MALAHTLYEHLGLLKPAREGALIRSVRLLVPVDDYFDLWQADQKALDNTSSNDRRADLLDVQVEIADDGVTIAIQVLEVKNLRLTYGGSTLAGPAEQVRATYRTLSTVFFGPTGSGRRDLPTASRTRPGARLPHPAGAHATLGRPVGALEVAAISDAPCTKPWWPHMPGCAGVRADDGQEQSAGVVLHFSSEPAILTSPWTLPEQHRGPATRRTPCPLRPFGPEDVATLLRNAGGWCQTTYAWR